MVIQEFSFGNFRSFKDIQTLNLSAAKIKSKNEVVLVTDDKKERILAKEHLHTKSDRIMEKYMKKATS